MINIDPYKEYLNSYVAKRLNSMINKNISDDRQGVSVVTCTNRHHKIDAVFDNFIRQNYINKELIIILNNNDLVLDEYVEKAKEFSDIKVFQIDEKMTLGDCFNFALKHAKFDYIAKFDDDDYYGRDYLTQAMETFEQQPCDVVGKAAYYIYFDQTKTLALYGENKQNMFINRVADASLVFKRHVFNKVKIPIIKKAGTFAMFQTELIKQGLKIYSTDKYNFLVNRYNDQEHDHTWKVSDEVFLGYKLVKIIAENVTDSISYVEKER